jgi:hypothetical protein
VAHHCLAAIRQPVAVDDHVQVDAAHYGNLGQLSVSLHWVMGSIAQIAQRGHIDCK